MAAAVPTIEPTAFRAGETVQWTKSLSDYSYADGWRLTYYLRGPATLNVSATADTDGRGHSVTISAADTAKLQAGQYWIEGRVTCSGATYVVYSASLVIGQNLSTVSAGFDGRTHARKCRDALRSIIEGTAGSLVIDYTIFGERNVKLMTVAERLQLLTYYESRVAEEEKAERLQRGERTGIYIRFRSAR